VPETVALSLQPLPRNANGKVMKKLLREELGAGYAERPTARPGQG